MGHRGQSPANRSAQTFPIGKSQLFVYSTLRPAPAPDGSLHLTTADRKWFNGAIVLAIALIGLPLFRRSTPRTTGADPTVDCHSVAGRRLLA